ncbi:MAG: hypothetical protein CMP51_04115 [Flavobacteriales bacterium]|nr:hypothetical protein [Flavobacteriales bacterium]
MKYISQILILLFLPITLISQIQTVGLFHKDSMVSDGYILFSPNNNTYLIDNCGRKIHEWNSNYKPGSSVYLLEDGSLLRTCRMQSTIFTGGGSGGRVEKYSWDNSLLWSYNFSDSIYHQHHDIAPMNNGNILILCWEYMSEYEAINSGRDPNALVDDQLWTTYILEVEPIGVDEINIVWEWHLKDHLIQDFDSTKNNYGIVENHPELVDINYYNGLGKQDWMHCNSINYNEISDEIIISSRAMSEIYIIDHSTSTMQASGHAGGFHNQGGDIVFRWGNPQVYRGGTASDRKFFGQHDAHWITSNNDDIGKIMVFNNGQGRGYSSIDIILPEKDSSSRYVLSSNGIFLPNNLTWTYVDSIPPNFFSSYISGSQRISNGNTLICSGAKGRFFEIDTNEQIVWEYINPVLPNTILSQGDLIPSNQNGLLNSTFRCNKYQLDHPAFTDRTMIPGEPLEINPVSNICDYTIHIYNMKSERKLLKSIDILGRNIGDYSKQFFINIYSDGTVEKILILE